jgi:hypothetical protein
VQADCDVEGNLAEKGHAQIRGGTLRLNDNQPFDF